MQDKDLIWEEVSTEHLIRDEWIDFRKTAFRMPDGRVFQPYYSYSRRNYAVIVASDEKGDYICVRQFRQGIRNFRRARLKPGTERIRNRRRCMRRSGSCGRKPVMFPTTGGCC